MLDIQAIRKDFPILNQKIYNHQIVYFDNAATSQKPQIVIDTTNEYYLKYNSNIHRGVHYLSEKMTEAYENARKTVKSFINAKFQHEIIFTSGTTESINLVAFAFGEKYISENDEIIISQHEHHSNIVPWQMMCERKGAKIKVLPSQYNGELDLNAYKNLFNDKTKIVAVNHASNSLGTINNIETIIKIAHEHNVPVLIDGAQGIQHQIVDVQQLDCDFYTFSGHKIYGPTGTGVLYGKEKWLNEMPPYKGGGDMIKTVTFEKTTYNALPLKYEAGTANFVGAIGLSAAIKYVEIIGMKNIIEYEEMLFKYLNEKISKVPEIRIYGTAKNKICLISFLLGKIHHFDTGMMLDKMDIAVRTGNHCNQPTMQFYGIEGTVRASLTYYNTIEEIDYFIDSLIKVEQLFG
ncbi:MAG: cysteine desulfurase CsdA [Bacteroidetes bacterium CG02_land_8_20_14_3_00_31_25]|nr:cysteine desulfurase [Bacteroidota bacterium]PIV58675.1 MAG: cysteine desulfurase CsdA [Bacteroidetes bacterium CG02_land_8_20_14_3_00_31_25]PIX33309.1 MAG: cysteine desulfurase CsdA [Bacteroidetes bacterium CG_4_8_14_3_um_filter_31_14]PIY03312.1 MAG: cysteine desulfurase CsdA [Bacteroidetes bacterium CG_4_10_14_3_um_filter_31_20]